MPLIPSERGTRVAFKGTGGRFARGPTLFYQRRSAADGRGRAFEGGLGGSLDEHGDPRPEGCLQIGPGSKQEAPGFHRSPMTHDRPSDHRVEPLTGFERQPRMRPVAGEDPARGGIPFDGLGGGLGQQHRARAIEVFVEAQCDRL